MNQRHLAAALVVAIAGHLGVLLWPLARATLPTRDPIVIEALPAPSPPRARGSGSGGPGGGRGAGGLTLKQLGITPTPYGDFSLPAGEVYEAPAGSGDGVRGTPLEGVGDYVKHDRFFEEIDSALFYPTEFLSHGIGGKVEAELFFSDGNAFNEKRSRVRSASRYLRVHVLRVVRRVFADGVLWARPGDKDFILLCTFHFDPVKSTASLSQRLSARKLVFYRYGAVPGQWSVGPLHGVGAMPAVGVDPNWFVEQFAGRKAEADPLETYRHDPAW